VRCQKSSAAPKVSTRVYGSRVGYSARTTEEVLHASGVCRAGDMGQAIVPRLIAAGTRSRAESHKREGGAAIQAGHALADCRGSLRRDRDVVFSIVTDSEVVKALALGTTESSLDCARRRVSGHEHDRSGSQPRHGAEFRRPGLIMMDAPIGDDTDARAGKASLMVGGDKRRSSAWSRCYWRWGRR